VGANRYVHMMFAAGGLLLAFLLVQTGDWLWTFVSKAKPPDLYINLGGFILAGLIAFRLWRSERVFGLASEVVNELKKVTWPTRKETSAATVVVIITVLIAAVILWAFDLFWIKITGLIYG
jgi:preprotein translocase SecE subunit